MSPSRTVPSRRFFFFLFALTLSLGLLFSPLFSMGQNIPVAHAQLTCAEPHILVSNGRDNTNFNGSLIQGFNTSFGFENTVNVGSLDDPHDMTIGPDGNLYIADTRNGRIQRYNFETPAVETVATVAFPLGLTFDTNNDLYITGGGSAVGGNAVFRVTGLFDTAPPPTLPIAATIFVPTTDIGTNYTLNRVHEGLEFGPDGHLYVVSNTEGGIGHHGILRFNGSTGAYMNTVATFPVSAGYNVRDLAFGPDGYLYVSEVHEGRIRYYELGYDDIPANFTSTEISSFAIPAPVGMTFSPTGDLFVAEYNELGGQGEVNRLTFSGGSWSIVGSFGNDELDQTKALIFTQCLDWGDLPNTYGTQFSSDGPRHLIDNTLRLGVCVDGETNGQPSMIANGDDSSEFDTITFGTCVNADDEDGVVFPRPVDDLPRSNWSDGTGHIDVTVTGGDACLNVWVDFGDGTASPPNDQFDVGAGLGIWNEHVIVNQTVSTGVTEFNFTLPADVADDTNLAVRARLTPRNADNSCDTGGTAEAYLGGVASPTGLATGGEIEDYIVEFSPTAVSLSQNPTATPSASQTLPIVAFLLMGLTVLLLWRRPAGVRE